MVSRARLEIASCTDPGVQRTYNDDSIAVSEKWGVVVLADGMGGHQAGDVAARMVTDTVLSELAHSASRHIEKSQAQRAMSDAVRKANRAIHERAKTNKRFNGMGATLVALRFLPGLATVGHVGDARLYLLRDERLEQLTLDHSLLQEQVSGGLISGEDAKVSHNRNFVTRALGVEEDIEPEVGTLQPRPGDLFLLCSDGLNDMVDNADIELVLNALKGNIGLAARQLVMIANDHGGHDNVSVILVKVGEPDAAGGFLGQLLTWIRGGRARHG